MLVKSKYFNKQLLSIGAGTLGAMFTGAYANNYFSGMNNFIGQYATEITGVSLVLAGSMMMSSGNANAKKAGMGAGGVGISILANQGYKAITNSGLQGTPELNAGQTTTV